MSISINLRLRTEGWEVEAWRGEEVIYIIHEHSHWHCASQYTVLCRVRAWVSRVPRISLCSIFLSIGNPIIWNHIYETKLKNMNEIKRAIWKCLTLNSFTKLIFCITYLNPIFMNGKHLLVLVIMCNLIPEVVFLGLIYIVN